MQNHELIQSIFIDAYSTMCDQNNAFSTIKLNLVLDDNFLQPILIFSNCSHDIIPNLDKYKSWCSGEMQVYVIFTNYLVI